MRSGSGTRERLTPEALWEENQEDNLVVLLIFFHKSLLFEALTKAILQSSARHCSPQAASAIAVLSETSLRGRFLPSVCLAAERNPTCNCSTNCQFRHSGSGLSSMSAQFQKPSCASASLEKQTRRRPLPCLASSLPVGKQDERTRPSGSQTVQLVQELLTIAEHRVERRQAGAFVELLLAVSDFMENNCSTDRGHSCCIAIISCQQGARFLPPHFHKLNPPLRPPIHSCEAPIP